MANQGLQLDEGSIQFLHKPTITFDDICGLKDVKEVIKEYIFLPLKFPKLFSGANHKLSRTILVFGAPGVGKSYLLRSIASQCTLFRCYFAQLISRWYGTSDFNCSITELFDNAKKHEPSCIVIEEFESCNITLDPDLNYAWLINRQLSAIEEGGHNVHVVFITQRPADFPEMLLKRCDLLIHIPMPDVSARVQMFHSFLEGVNSSGIYLCIWKRAL